MKILLVLLALVLTFLPLFAANDAIQTQLLAMDSAFVKGHYSEVELVALRILQSAMELTLQERSHINLTAGYALIMMNREHEAREYFDHALDAEPDLTLDPVQVSPKFRMVFDEVKAQHQNSEQVIPYDDRTIKVSPLQPASRRSLISNLIIPGSGQWREGHHVRGAAFLLAQAASLGVWIWQMDQTRDSHAKYLAQTNAQRIADTYNEYNQDYALSWATGALAGIIYLAAQADLILLRTPTKELSFLPVSHSGAGVTLRATW